MKKLLVSFSIIALIAGFASCGKKDSPAPSTNAYVNFAHGCASGTTAVNLDGRVNNLTVNGAGNMTFQKSSGYLPVTAGTGVSLSFFVTGLNTLISQNEDLTANTYYTAFAGGSITTPSLVFVTDDRSAPASGMAKIRFVNLSPDNLNMSCYLGTAKIDSSVGYKTCTPFFQVAATSAKISMIDQVTLSNSESITSQTLTAGKIYTFILTGSATGAGTSVLTLGVIGNN